MKELPIVSSIEFGQMLWKYYKLDENGIAFYGNSLLGGEYSVRFSHYAIARHTYDNLLIRKVVESDFVRPLEPTLQLSGKTTDGIEMDGNEDVFESLHQEWESWVPLFMWKPPHIKDSTVWDLKHVPVSPDHPTLQSINYKEIIT